MGGVRRGRTLPGGPARRTGSGARGGVRPPRRMAAGGGGEAPLPPDPGLTTAADLLRMIAGAPAPEPRVAALDTYFAAVLENGLNTSAFAARVIASSGASLVAAALGAYCAFSGPRH